MNLGQFHSRVSGAIKRGSSLDAIIPFWVSDAARILEQNYTFSWMRNTNTVTFPTSDVPASYALSPLIKSVNWLKPQWEGTDGSVWYGEPLPGVSDEKVEGISGGAPSGFWLEGTDGAFVLKMDFIPSDEYKVRLSWNKYTAWPVDDAAEPTLLLRGQTALFFQTLILFANEMKDPTMATQYGGMLEGALSTLLRSEEELKMSHQNDLRMGYQGLR